jgi:hypothetical protein
MRVLVGNTVPKRAAGVSIETETGKRHSGYRL